MGVRASASQPATFRSMKLIRYTALLLLLLALSACGTQNSGPVGAIQADFSARPLEKGDGSWELVWDTDANSVTLDGTAVEKSGSLEVIHADPHTYELIARRGNQNVTR